MAFWAFGLAQDGGIDSLLDKWEPDLVDASAVGDLSAESAKTTESLGNGKDDASNSSPSIGIAEDDSVDSISGNSGAKQAGNAKKPLTLEQLLDEDDLLQELKNGHAKLVSSFWVSIVSLVPVAHDINTWYHDARPMPSHLSRSSTFFRCLPV